MRSLILFLLPVLAACTSDAPVDAANQGGPVPPPPQGGGNPGPGNPNPGGGPAPATFDDSHIDLGKPGAFPSDLIRAGDGTLLTVDDATIPANVVGYRGTTRSLSVPITAADLIDMDGTRPASAPTLFGPGLFGAFTGDLELAFERWLLVTVGAGNSLSPVRLANLVVIDTQAARVVQTINLGWTLDAPGKLSSGGNYAKIPQSLPVMCKFVPARNGTQTGRVYVALSNGAGSNVGLNSFYSGTVQSWRADFTQVVPLFADVTGTPATAQTVTYLSEYYNPVALTRYTALSGVSFLLLTGAGASLFDASGIAHATTDAVLEVLDLDTRQWRPEWEMNLGQILPAPHALAVGVDLAGNHFGMLASQTFAAAYVVDLTGLESNPVNVGDLGLRRTIELATNAATVGSGFQPGIGLSPSGRSAVVSSFTTSSLTVIDIPGDVLFQEFTLNPPPFDGDLSATQSLGLAALVVGDDVHVIVNGDFVNFPSNRAARIGVLDTGGRLP